MILHGLKKRKNQKGEIMFNLLGAAETAATETSTADKPVIADWMYNSFPIIKFILLVLILLAAIGLIVVVLLQQSEEGGSNAIMGIKESYYSQNKGANKEGRLKKATIILSVFIAVAVIIFFILTEYVPRSIWSQV